MGLGAAGPLPMVQFIAVDVVGSVILIVMEAMAVHRFGFCSFLFLLYNITIAEIAVLFSFLQGC